MEDSESLDCMVCSRVAQYAVLTPCCSSLACRICAVTNIVKSQGKCGACHSSPVLLSSLVPHHQVRKKAEEIEVSKQVNERESEEKVEKWESIKRTLDDSSESNKIGSKRMKLDKSDHSDLNANESNNTYSPQKVLHTETMQTKNETIGCEISKRANSNFENEKCEAKSALEASVAKDCHDFDEDDQDAVQSRSGPRDDEVVMKELKDANKTLTFKENELEQLKKIIKCKNEELNKIKLSSAEEEVTKITEKLSLADEEIKRMLVKNKALTANIESLKREKKKLEEENQLLKNANKGDNIGTNDNAKGTTSDADMRPSIAELEAVIAKSSEEVNEIRTANKALKRKMDEKEERYRKVLVKAKAKIQKVELQNSELQKKLIENQVIDESKATKIADNEERTIKVSTNAIVELENRDLREKLADSDLHSQFGQPKEIYQKKEVFVPSIYFREEKNEDEIEENTEDKSKTEQHEEILKTDSNDETTVEQVEFNDYNYWKIDTFDKFHVKPFSDENNNGFSEKGTFPDIISKPTSDTNRIQSADSTTKWRIIFMDCEKISDGDHTQFTQIGCYVYRVSNRRKSSVFLPMFPTKHKEYLQMKQKSDLLKMLNLTWEKEIGFQFVEPDGAKVKAQSESEGLEDLLIFLGVTSEDEDNVLFINNAQCILPLLFNKISLDLLQKYVAGICELNTFLSRSLNDNHLAYMSHTDDIYRSVMEKSFEEITPTCAQTAKYMFKIVEKICSDQGNPSLNFESFISKYFEPTSYFIEKFGHLSATRNANASGEKVSLEIETSFRPGFPATVEMYRVDMVDLTGISEFPKNSKKQVDTFIKSEFPENRQKHTVNPPRRVLTVGNYKLTPIKGKTVTILVEFEGIDEGVEEVSLCGPIPLKYYRFSNMQKKMINRPSIKVVEGNYGFLEIGLTKKSIITPRTHKITAGTHILNYSSKFDGSIPSSFEADLDMFMKCNRKNLHNISNCVDENMYALLMRSNRFPAPIEKLPSNLTLPAPIRKLPPKVTLPAPTRKLPPKVTLPVYTSKLPPNVALPAPTRLFPSNVTLPVPTRKLPSNLTLPTPARLLPSNVTLPAPARLLPSNVTLPAPTGNLSANVTLPAPSGKLPSNVTLPAPARLLPPSNVTLPAPTGNLSPNVTLPAPSGKLPSNVTLPVPVPARKTVVHRITEATLRKTEEISIVHKITEMSEATLRKTEETSKISLQTTQTNHPTKPSSSNNPRDQSCSKDSTEPCNRHNFWDQYCKSCIKNRPEQLCFRNPMEESCSKNPMEESCSKNPMEESCSKNPIEESCSKNPNPMEESCIKNPIEESCSKNPIAESCSKNAAKQSCDKKCPEQPCMKDPSNLTPIPLSLRCSLCSDLLRDAVILPCCMASTCDACAREMLLREDFTCKLCMGKRLRLDLLIPSVKLRRDVFEFRQLM